MEKQEETNKYCIEMRNAGGENKAKTEGEGEGGSRKEGGSGKGKGRWNRSIHRKRKQLHKTAANKM